MNVALGIMLGLGLGLGSKGNLQRGGAIRSRETIHCVISSLLPNETFTN